ncbi:MAG TPA: multicopper oxidase domain-containing protein, partial [Ktedonobacterales bacterium]|nr:multicopper oxidase domain-containing protein [Ktedonobacterales bacterium]
MNHDHDHDHDHDHTHHHDHGGMHTMSATSERAGDSFSRETDGLAEAAVPAIVELSDGDTFELTAHPVRKRIGGATVRMLAYNGSIPGPVLRVAQGAQVTVHFTNQTDLETTVHWHGLRLDNEFDGVPRGHPHHGMQRPVAPGESFTYRVRFPDPGVYWYHPHIREDYAQEMGLYGNIVVAPTSSDPAYWSPVNRELALTLDDILIEGGDVAAYSRAESNHTAMGRFGNVLLINGEPAPALTLEANRGDVMRLYLTNTANVRIFNVGIPGTGARMKLVGRDHGRVEREEWTEQVMLAPSERAVVEVLFEQAGDFALEHRTPEQTYRLGTIRVREQPVERSYAREFGALRHCAELAAERSQIEADFERAPDKTLALVGEMPGMSHHDHHAHGHGDHMEHMEHMGHMEHGSSHEMHAEHTAHAGHSAASGADDG